MSSSAANQPPPPPGSRLTFQQLISVIDSRLSKLETGAKEKVSLQSQVPDSALEELDAKFMMLAEEITTMKDVIMKLQAFTMDVNKTLFEERIRIMSDIDGDIKTQVVEEVVQLDNVSTVAI
jgi:hypothetical protein